MITIPSHTKLAAIPDERPCVEPGGARGPKPNSGRPAMALSRRALFITSAALALPAAFLSARADTELDRDGWPKCARWPSCVFSPRAITVHPEDCGGKLPE